MTVGGVAGCTALIVCGLAINDTVADLGIKQYRDIYQYDLMVVSDDSDASAMRTKVASDGRVTSSLDVRIESGDLTVAGSGDGDSGKGRQQRQRKHPAGRGAGKASVRFGRNGHVAAGLVRHAGHVRRRQNRFAETRLTMA